MLPTSLSFTSAFIVGLLGTTHCIAMCGGIASSLSLGGQRRASSISGILSYNLGRILSYTLAGALLGIAGASIQDTSAAPLLRILAGSLLVAMGLYLAQWWFGLTKLEHAGAILWRSISPLLKPLIPADTVLKAFMLGIGWAGYPVVLCTVR